ncbi:MAG: hypothetical protein HYS21_12345 [Deltaproteobacteria bacterium]|nr:hypothetical protein [Deltaproteobacteria bacterium]
MFFSGCAGWRQVKQTRALENLTPVTENLTKIPPPKRKISVTVYKTKDMTGQYKFHPTATSFSTAVTQGSTPMVIKAALDSGWFLMAEREGLGDLLTEQKILKQKLGFMGKDTNVEQNLLLPEFIIEGGITEFNENIVTGGVGIKYFGVGPNTKVSIASAVIDLRLVRVTTGMVVDTVSVSKRILSYEADFGVFRFVKTNRLLEVEIGVTNNEPVQMAVREAIETAVSMLIARGVKSGLWEPSRPEDAPYFDKLLVTETPSYLPEDQDVKPFWEVFWPEDGGKIKKAKNEKVEVDNRQVKPFWKVFWPKEDENAREDEKKQSRENVTSVKKAQVKNAFMQKTQENKIPFEKAIEQTQTKDEPSFESIATEEKVIESTQE